MTEPPRRLSTEDGDFPEWAGRVLVFLDGVDQAGRCTAYDVDAGTVTRAKLNEAGELYCVHDEIAMEIVSDKVEVRLKDAHNCQRNRFREAERALSGARWTHYQAAELIKLIRKGAAV